LLISTDFSKSLDKHFRFPWRTLVLLLISTYFGGILISYKNLNYGKNRVLLIMLSAKADLVQQAV